MNNQIPVSTARELLIKNIATKKILVDDIDKSIVDFDKFIESRKITDKRRRFCGESELVITWNDVVRFLINRGRPVAFSVK